MSLKNLDYKRKLLLFFVLLFIVFSALFTWAQVQREKEHTKEIYRTQFELVSDLVAVYVDHYPVDSVHYFVERAEKLDNLISAVKIRVLNSTGEYLIGAKEKHAALWDYSDEPEVQNALIQGIGSGIRKPFGSEEEHFYYARQYPDFIIWMDMPFVYNRNIFASGNYFSYFLILLFLSGLWLVMWYADNLRKNTQQMCDFLDTAGSGKLDMENFHFPNTELGLLSRRLVTNYTQLQQSKDEINVLQEKLIRHFHYVQEGICIFTPQREKVYANALFVQYVSNILSEPTFDMSGVFHSLEFAPMVSFLEEHSPVRPNAVHQPSFSGIIQKNGRTYAVRLLLFNDNSFEVSLNDTTRLEQNKTLKQEMTNNIAHELKTPVSSIRGYLETLLVNDHIDEDNRRFFLERAYNQTLRLTELIQDVSFLNKIEEAGNLFPKERLVLKDIVDEVGNDLHLELQKKKITYENAVGSRVLVNGNRTLLYALFRNLVENTMHYAGEDVTIHIEDYDADAGLYHIDYYDTGKGVDDVHLARLFDRFYRVEEGRTRKDGGSGLGLAIVKNAVQFHNGMISARRHKDHGLEFVFSLERFKE